MPQTSNAPTRRPRFLFLALVALVIASTAAPARADDDASSDKDKAFARMLAQKLKEVRSDNEALKIQVEELQAQVEALSAGSTAPLESQAVEEYAKRLVAAVRFFMGAYDEHVKMSGCRDLTPLDTERAFMTSTRTQGPKREASIIIMNEMAREFLLHFQDPHAAERLHRRIYDVRLEEFGPDDPRTLNARGDLACAMAGCGYYEAAVEHLLAIVPKRMEDPETYTWDNDGVRDLAMLADLLFTLGRHEEAEPWLAAASGLKRPSFIRKSYTDYTMIATQYAPTLVALDRRDEAIEIIESKLTYNLRYPEIAQTRGVELLVGLELLSAEEELPLNGRTRAELILELVEFRDLIDLPLDSSVIGAYLIDVGEHDLAERALLSRLKYLPPNRDPYGFHASDACRELVRLYEITDDARAAERYRSRIIKPSAYREHEPEA